MKWLAVVAKNLKLLFRSHESAFTIIFGPLLIILLVSAAYTGSDDKTLRVGTVASDYTPLADQMITTLKKDGYLVSTFTNESDCVERITKQELHVCVLFPDDFRVKENATSTVTFAVDYSRINLVHQILQGLSAEFLLQREEISEDITETMLQRIAVAQQDIHAQREAAEIINEELARANDEIAVSQEDLANVNLEIAFVDLREVKGQVTRVGSLVDDARREGDQAARDAIKTLETARGDAENNTKDLIATTISELQNVSVRLEGIQDESSNSVIETSYAIDDAAFAVSQVEQQFAAMGNISIDVQKRLSQAAETMSDVAQRLTTLRGTLAHVDTSLQESLGIEAGSIATPIATRIQAINTEKSQVAFTYPYVLLLVIMFLGLMLSSSLVVMDKTSRAAFRNFTTATRDEHLVLLGFVTTFFILLAQALLILLVSYWLIDAPLFANFGVSLLIISAAITLFSFLGMIIGYLSNTQESAMITSLSLGSILLFISNLVLPLEAMNTVVQALSGYNPYVVLSELLKQSMLFDLKLRYVPVKVALIGITLVVLFLLILSVQKSVKSRYFRQRNKDLAANEFAPAARAVAPLQLHNKEVHDLFDLLAALDAMTRTDFETIVAANNNPIRDWVRHEVRDRALARKLDTRSKELMILALDNYLKKQTKKLAK